MSAHQHTHQNDQQPVDELVLVIHGVGDPEPGETLSLFARSVAESGNPLTEHKETLWLEDESDSVRDVNTFGTNVRHLKFEGNNSTLAEVYWGDLSRVHRGLVGVLSGMIQIVFGLRYIAFVASHQGGIAAQGLQWLGLIVSRLVHGPVLAVNFLLGILVLTVAGTESLWPGSSQVTRWASFLTLGCVAICFIASYLGWRLTRNSVCHRFWYWVAISAVFLNGLTLLSLFAGLDFSLVAYCNVMVTMLGAQWIALVAALLLMTAFWLAALLKPSNYRPALHVALILPAMAVGIWGQALPLMWVTASNSIMKIVPKSGQPLGEFVTTNTHESHNGHSHNGQSHAKTPVEMENADKTVDASLLAQQISNSVLGSVPNGHVIAAANRAPFTRVISEQALKTMASKREARQTIRAQFATMFEKAVPLIGVQCLMCLLLGLVMIVQLARYMRWSERSRISDYHAGSRAPRLIVNEVFQVALIISSIVGMCLVLYVTTHEFTGHDNKTNWFCALLIEANKYAIGFLVPVAGILLLSAHLMRPVLDIVLDVANHFYFRSATTADRVRGFGEDFDIDEVTFDGGELYYSRRDKIHRRIKRVLDYYRQTLPGNPALTIVSHSQGTMIAIEVFNDAELDWVSKKFSKVNFITMGSPFHHIYQKYFGHFYPSLDDPHWSNLRSRVSRWLNIFRIDDFVGTEIDFPKTMPESVNGAYSNLAVERKGHMRYWCDRQVLQIIRQHDICRSLSSHSRMSRKQIGKKAA